MQIILYNSTAESNRVDKSTSIEVLFTLDGFLRDGCSILDPVVKVSMPAGTNVSKINYAYIADFGRYYFVTDIRVDRNLTWEISMHSDPLMSFKEQLLNVTCMVARNEFNFDAYLNDQLMPFKNTLTVFEKQINSNLTASSPSVVCIVNIISKNPKNVTVANTTGDNNAYGGWSPYPPQSTNPTGKSLYTYAFVGDEVIRDFFDWLTSESGGASAASYIDSIYMLPFFEGGTYGADSMDVDISSVDGSQVSDPYSWGGLFGFDLFATSASGEVSVPVGAKTWKYRPPVGNSILLASPNAKMRYATRVSFSAIGYEFPKNFTRFSPRSTYSVYIPVAGWVDIDGRYLFAEKEEPYGLLFTTTIDPVTGDGLVAIMIQENNYGPNSRYRIADYKSISLLLPLPTTYTNADDIKRHQDANGWKLAGSVIGGAAAVIGGIALTVASAGAGSGAGAAMIAGGVGAIAGGAGAAVGGGLTYVANEILLVEVGGASQDASPSSNQYVNKNFVFRVMIQEALYNTDEELATYAHLLGRPCKKTGRLGDFKGLTVVDIMHLESIDGVYKSELEEISQMCISGILL